LYGRLNGRCACRNISRRSRHGFLSRCRALLRLIGNALDFRLTRPSLSLSSIPRLHAQAKASTSKPKARKVSAADVA
jgi:hypothetical protein